MKKMLFIFVALLMFSCAPSHEQVNGFQYMEAEYYVIHIDEDHSEKELREIMNLYIDPTNELVRHFFFYNIKKKDAGVFAQDLTWDEFANTLLRSEPHYSYTYHALEDRYEKNAMQYIEIAQN